MMNKNKEQVKMNKLNKYGYIIKGNTNIQNLWYARDSIVTTLNKLNIMILGRRNSPIVKELIEIIKCLRQRLRRTELKLVKFYYQKARDYQEAINDMLGTKLFLLQLTLSTLDELYNGIRGLLNDN